MKRRLASNWKSILLVLISLALFGWVLQSVSLPEVWATLSHLSPAGIGLLAIANGIVIALLTLRWRIFLAALGFRVPFLRLVAYRLAAFGVSYFTPGPHFGGEPLQVYLPVKNHGVKTSAAVTAVAMDKTLELFVNFAFLVAAALFVLQQGVLTGVSGVSIISYAVILLAIPTLLLGAIWLGRHPLSGPMAWWDRRRPSPRINAAGQRVRLAEDAAGELCRSRPGAVGLALIISLLAWLAMIGEFWLATYLLGSGLTPGQALFALLAMRLAILLPMPAGLGALEAGLVMAMEMVGVSGAVGLSLALLIRARDVLLGLLGLLLAGYNLWRRPVAPEALVESLAESLPEPLAEPFIEPRGNLHEISR